jgi:hypothetical protein
LLTAKGTYLSELWFALSFSRTAHIDIYFHYGLLFFTELKQFLSTHLVWQLLLFSGSIKVFCRVRPLFEDESPSVVEFPDDCTIRVNTGSDTISNPKKDFEFDRVYGPHVGQGLH